MTIQSNKAPQARTYNLAVAAAVSAVLSGAHAQAADTSAQASNTDKGETIAEIMVFGRGETRQVAEVGAIDIQAAAPGTSALKVLAKLPGVSFQSADPYGAYEWSTRLSIRGFQQYQLGFTLDGVPLGDMSYGNHNGLHISRAISAENIGRVVLSQGAGALETASSSNLGGTLQFISADPAHEMGVSVALTGGSDSNKRGFVRFETGDLGSARTRAYLSYTNQYSWKWKGDGKQKQEQINFKVVQPVGDAKLTAFYNWSDRQENDYQDLSLSMINRLGYDWDNLSGPVGVDSANWDLIKQISSIYQANGFVDLPGAYPPPILSVDDAYFNASGLRKDKLAGATLNLPFGDSVSWNTTVYVHKNDGRGIWFEGFRPTPVGAPDGFGGTITDPAPVGVRTTEYDIDRKGVTTALTWMLGAHAVNGGLWYEDNDFNHARRFYGLQNAAPQRDSLKFMKDPFFTQWQYAFNTKTTQFFLQDTWTVNDELKVNFGFKSLDVKNKSRAEGPPVLASGEIEAKKSFLPQVGFNYVLNSESEMFGDVTRNMEAFQSAATIGPFATSAAGFAAIKDSLKPETSTTYEVGYRYNAAAIQAVATVYYVDFKDRLLAFQLGSGIVGNPIVLENVGDVETKGAEAGVRWAFASSWNWYNSLSFNDSKYKDNVLDGTGAVVARTAGKTVVDAPKQLFKSELGYDNGALFGKVGLDYVGKRYFTYTNSLCNPSTPPCPPNGDGNGKVDSYAVLNLGLGYRIEKLGIGKNFTVQANVTNVTDKQYISTIGSNGFRNSGDRQTFLAGSPRQWFLSVSGQF
jgi:iron complex outermembrane receptor protein